MSKKVMITSTLTQPFVLFYRMPTGENGKVNPVLEIALAPRQILKEVIFPTEKHFEEFQRQNAFYINSKKIIIGSNVTGSQAQKINADNTKKEQASINAKKSKVVESIEAAGSSGKASLKVDVSKE